VIVKMTSENVLTLGLGYFHRCPKDSFQHPVNGEILAPKLAGFIDAGVGFGWLALDPEGRPEGVFFGLIIEDLFTSDLVAQELFWHTLPVGRKRGIGMALFRAFLEEAKRRKCRDVLVGYQMTEQNGFLHEIYRRMGFKLIAAGYKKAI
jgi:GNAT superfamily N-acetyltransferase